MDGGCRSIKADIGKVIARGLQGHRLSTTVDIATIQSPDTHPSDNPSLCGSRRINVPKESAAYALGNTGRADGLLKPGGHILADTGIDGEWSAVLQSTVDAQLDTSQGLMGRMDRQCLYFTVVDIGRVAGMTYSLVLVARVLVGGHIAIIGGSVTVIGGSVTVIGGSVAVVVGSVGLSGGCIVRNGGSVDGDGEDNADDGEKLCREHHDDG